MTLKLTIFITFFSVGCVFLNFWSLGSAQSLIQLGSEGESVERCEHFTITLLLQFSLFNFTVIVLIQRGSQWRDVNTLQ